MSYDCCGEAKVLALVPVGIAVASCARATATQATPRKVPGELLHGLQDTRERLFEIVSRVCAGTTVAATSSQITAKYTDSDGRPFVAEMMRLGAAQGSGWIDYKWAHPVTNASEAKTSYFERYEGVLIACGAYKQD